MVLVFPEKYISAFARDMSSCHGEPQVFRAEASFHELFLRYLYDGSCPDEYLLSSILLGLCHSFAASCRIVPNPDRKKAAVVVKMMNYISSHYRDELSLKDVSDALGYSYHYLSHLFREYTGLSFHQFCSMKRIEHARNLLESTSSPIAEIAYDCGFSCIRTFNRAFLSQTGYTPAAYRREFVHSDLQMHGPVPLLPPKTN